MEPVNKKTPHASEGRTGLREFTLQVEALQDEQSAVLKKFEGFVAGFFFYFFFFFCEWISEALSACLIA